MSLLQEMETHGLADCEFNRRLWKNDRRIKRLINIHLENFNTQEEDFWLSGYDYEENCEGDYIPLTAEQAETNGDFIYWCSLWEDRRRELYELLKGL